MLFGVNLSWNEMNLKEHLYDPRPFISMLRDRCKFSLCFSRWDKFGSKMDYEEVSHGQEGLKNWNFFVELAQGPCSWSWLWGWYIGWWELKGISEHIPAQCHPHQEWPSPSLRESLTVFCSLSQISVQTHCSDLEVWNPLNLPCWAFSHCIPEM